MTTGQKRVFDACKLADDEMYKCQIDQHCADPNKTPALKNLYILAYAYSRESGATFRGFPYCPTVRSYFGEYIPVSMIAEALKYAGKYCSGYGGVKAFTLIEDRRKAAIHLLAAEYRGAAAYNKSVKKAVKK